jgi:hypothetical protein
LEGNDLAGGGAHRSYFSEGSFLAIPAGYFSKNVSGL